MHAHTSAIQTRLCIPCPREPWRVMTMFTISLMLSHCSTNRKWPPFQTLTYCRNVMRKRFRYHASLPRRLIRRYSDGIGPEHSTIAWSGSRRMLCRGRSLRGRGYKFTSQLRNSFCMARALSRVRLSKFTLQQKRYTEFSIQRHFFLYCTIKSPCSSNA